ncbi:Tetratricopeptide repeat-containing protein [Burkholderia sp. YR290]|nr:Tetratricopeptide repeat-containing protein [Burkholderia sp. YR290]
MSHYLYVHWITAMFLFWNGARILAYLPTVAKVWARDADVRSYSLVSWGIWFFSNVTFALMLFEAGGAQPNQMFWMNVGNATMCIIVFVLILLKKARLATSVGHTMPNTPTNQLDIWTLRDQGNTLMRLCQYEEAIRAYDAYLTHFQDSAATLNQALCLEKLGRLAEALPLYQELAERNVLSGLVNGSNCLKKMGDINGALEYATRATRLDQGDPAAWIALGSLQFTLGAWRDAVESYSRARQLDPMDPTLPYNAALAALRMNDTDLAREALQAFLSLAPLDDGRRRLPESRSAGVVISRPAHFPASAIRGRPSNSGSTTLPERSAVGPIQVAVRIRLQ